MPHVKRTAALAVLAFVLLVLGVRAVGAQAHAWQADPAWWGPVQAITEWVMQIVGGVAALLKGKGGAPLSQRIGCLLMLIVFFVMWRRAMLARNAYRPGPVDVQKLVASGPEVEPQVEGLTAQLRKYLSETNLYPPTALPAEPPADNFIDLLGDVDIEPKKFGTSLLRLFSRIRPKVAYTVRGVLREQAQEARCGVTITVTSYAMRGSRTETLWAATWDDVVRLAGNWVMSSLVPVTRAGKRPPWQEWHGRCLQPELFAAYQEGRRLSKERKFDAALERYYTALRLDPSNLYLRTQIAGIQEKLWLHIDALETYYGAMLLDGCTEEERDRRLTMGRWNPLRWRRRYRWWRNGLLEVRFRYAVVLGIAEQTAKQWCTTRYGDDYCPRRARAREEIRQAMTPAFVDRYWRAFLGSTHPGGLSFGADEPLIRGWLTGLLDAHQDRETIRVVFQRACAEEMNQIVRDTPWSSLLPFVVARYRGTLTWASLRLNQQVWAPLRLAWAMDGHYPRYWSSGLQASPVWLESAQQLDERVQRVLDRPLGHFLTRWAREWNVLPRRPWQDSYNAACVYAAAMNHQFHRKDGGELARYAVRALEDATRTDRSSSQYLAGSWLLTEDPDLVALRRQPRFVRFERETYPHAAPDRHRSERPLTAEIMACHHAVLRATAEVMEHTWHDRRKRLPVEFPELARWFASEVEMWERVYQFARNRGCDWRDRERLLQAVRGVAEPALVIRRGLPAGLPELDDLLDAAWFEHGRSDGWVELFGASIAQRLTILSQDLKSARTGSPTAFSPISRSEQWLAAVRRDGALSHLVAQGAVRQACWDYEAVWRALGDQLDPAGDPRALSAVLGRLRRPRETWRGLAAGHPDGARRRRGTRAPPHTVTSRS
ncbi:hypothetical protein [Streptomyces sp. NPDC021096]|uniref:hypothetical protein n=1 Tax=Streptomyces sp. NPDC021096 TaxID=3154792 RepID=UPI00340ACA24